MHRGWLPVSRSRRLAALFLVVVAPPAVALTWLGFELLQNDRSFWEQRETELRRAGAVTVSRALEQRLAEVERLDDSGLPAGVARFTLSRNGIASAPANRVSWLPVSSSAVRVDDNQFAVAERLEFRGAAEEALISYRSLAGSRNVAVRAGALLRLARVHRRASRWDEAVAAYRELAAIRGLTISAAPADLVARRAECSVLEEAERATGLRECAAALETDLVAGRWILDRPTQELTTQAVARWTGHSARISPEREAFSEVGAWVWDEWRRNPFAASRPVMAGEHTVLWRAVQSGAIATALSPHLLRSWAEAAGRSSGTADRVALLSVSGRVIAGSKPSVSAAAVRLNPSDTGLPWTLVLSPGDASTIAQQFATRQRLMSVGLTALVLLLAGSSYVLWRVIQRELEVARLHTDFVSTVSHEFRTPLTSLRHITELLEEDDDMPREHRRSFYQALGRSTERLHRMVESLLDFSRMESGRKPYDLRPMDAAEFTARVVAEFRKEVETRGVSVELEVDPASALPVRADASSLSNALWNLLDNAVKYSPDGQTIRVSVGRHPSGVAIAVQDNGIGIPQSERGEIFRRFVRGEQAARLGIKGTGLGLAMVSHIVQAHAGAIELDSEEGEGSTFRMVLPERA
jgi:signal transduction histidine kinase